jgi:imidazolonepropionase-like amidohydrolase
MRLSRFVPLLVLAAAGSTAAATYRQQPARAELAVRAARILDVTTGRYSGPSVILIKAGRIAEIVPAARFDRGSADSVLDLGALTVLPGLIDAHVHLVIGGPPRANAEAVVRAGFTTVADLGSFSNRFLRVRDSINAGTILGPRVLAAGMWAGTKGGVCEFNGIGIPNGPEGFRARVRENVEAGADLIKVCVSGWPAPAYQSPDAYEIADSSLVAAVTAAHAAGRLVIAHAISRGAVLASARAGVEGLAHAAYVDSATAAGVKSRNMFLVPTLASLTNGDTSAVGRGLVTATGIAYRGGVRLVFGTDGGVLPHGKNADEFLALRQAGIPAAEMVRMATINAARALRIADSIGTVAPRMSADLIAVDGDPLADIGVLRTVRVVLLRGKVVSDRR